MSLLLFVDVAGAAGGIISINTHQTIDIIRGGRSGRQLLRGGDTNVYADTDGWIVAYFTRDELHGNAERNDRNT